MIPMIILAIENEDDREFMAQLYQDHERAMYAEVMKYISDPWVREDIVQDSLEGLINNLDTLRNKPRLINYIATTVRNKAKNYYRAKSKASFSSLDDEESTLRRTMASEDDVEEQIFRKDQLAKLSEIWPQLSESSQELLERKYILGQKDAEIAEAIHVKPASVRMKMTRARQEALALLKK